VWWLPGASPRPGELACLVLAAVLPGSVYEYALFPVSLVVAATLVFLAMAARQRWIDQLLPPILAATHLCARVIPLR
jgi:hypothetical protein